MTPETRLPREKPVKKPVRDLPRRSDKTFRRLRLFVVLVAISSVGSAAYGSCVGGGGTLYSTGDGSSCWYRCAGGKYNGRWEYWGSWRASSPKVEAASPTCAPGFSLKIQPGPDSCIGRGVIGPGKVSTAPQATPICADGKLVVDAADHSHDLCDLRKGTVEVRSPARPDR
jgi:hypothetical protein